MSNVDLPKRLWDKAGHQPVFENSPTGKRPLWNVNDVAEYLRVSDRTVRDWVYRRAIPFRKAGTSVRFVPEEIERWTLPNQGENDVH